MDGSQTDLFSNVRTGRHVEDDLTHGSGERVGAASARVHHEPIVFSLAAKRVFIAISPPGRRLLARELDAGVDPNSEHACWSIPPQPTHGPKPQMESAIATMTPAEPPSGTTRSLSVAEERP
jgi:hypothetical protein